MRNEFEGISSHSAEYFGETRDFWWNPDFIDLMAKRWRLSAVRDVLDVGCGIGHWGLLLGRVLPQEARVTGVDRDPLWIETATERARAAAMGDRFRYEVAVAERLPFPDASFDFVTCQTVLIHMRDPAASLREMVRVTRPGGTVGVAEPNNIVSSLVRDAARMDASIDDVLALSRFQLTCERGKIALGEGNNSIGDVVPGLFVDAGLRNVQVYTSDRAFPLLPPYASPAERAGVEEALANADREFWWWSREDTHRFFVAGGGADHDFQTLWSAAITEQKRIAAALRAGTYASGGGSLCYLVSGTKA